MKPEEPQPHPQAATVPEMQICSEDDTHSVGIFIRIR